MEFDADAKNEAIKRRRRRRRIELLANGTRVEFGCVENWEFPWGGRMAEEIPEELKRKREIGWSGEE